MAHPQTGITAATENHHYALEYSLLSASDAAHADLSGAAKVLGTRPDITRVIALGPVLCDAWNLDVSPAPFETISGRDGKTAPATQRDLLIWIQGSRRDSVFDAAMAADNCLMASFQRALEVPGFVRRESRDLTGFVDGSANPKGDLIAETAFIADDRPGAGGSYVLTQKWQHDLTVFNALPVPEQEGVIGRTKADSIELEGDDMPENSHVSRTDVAVDGETQRIYRRSFPYGTLDEHGLFFLAFARDQSRFDIQLRRMYGDTEDNIRDRITDFSTALTGSCYFAPDENTLKEILS